MFRHTQVSEAGRRRRPFVVIAALFASLVLGLSSPTTAHDHPAYYRGSEFLCTGGDVFPDRSDWMDDVPGSLRLSELSLPGTHDTMARFGGDAVACQTLTLREQLDAGIRVIDIRLRQHEDYFELWHGTSILSYQYAVFGADVLDVIIDFLQDNPSETVLMQIKKEGNDPVDLPLIDDPPIGTWPDVMDSYLAHPVVASYRWDGTVYDSMTQTQSNINPTLDEVRGKFVILDNYWNTPPPTGYYGITVKKADYFLNWGCDGQTSDPNPTFYKQSNYCFDTNWDLYEKWETVKGFLDLSSTAATRATTWGPDDYYWTSLGGSGGSFPYFVVSGHSNPCTGAPRLSTGCTDPTLDATGIFCDSGDQWPDFPRTTCVDFLFTEICTISFEGINTLLYNNIGARVAAGQHVFSGIVTTDFPGPGLIERIISLNPNPADPYVTTLVDDGSVVGSLRHTIENCWPGSTITFAPGLSGGTITLSDQIQILKSLVIDASALPGGITISGGGTSGIFYIPLYSPSLELVDIANVELVGLTLKDAIGAVSTSHPLTMRDCNVLDCTGAIGASAKLNLERVTIAGNSSPNVGGGLYCSGDANLVNCTIVDNTASDSGGGIFCNQGGVILTHCTVANNWAASQGGGIFSRESIILRSCIVADNYGGQGPDIYLDPTYSTTVQTLRACVVTDNTTVQAEFPLGSPNVNGDYVGVSANLSPLGDYGGRTLTMPPRADSPAVDATTPITVDELPEEEIVEYQSVTLDQRGAPRDVAGSTDIGAVELQLDERIQNLDTLEFYPTIQSAISAAVNGQEIVIAPGTYGEAIDLLGKSITLRGGSGNAADVIIDASGLSDSVVRCTSGEGSATVIESVTLTGGAGSAGPHGSFCGGGILCVNSSPTLNDCVFQSNSASFGAGLYCSNSSPGVSRCTFINNTASVDGGGMFCSSASGAVATNCGFFGNSADEGGGVALELGSNAALISCLFSGNTADNGAGLANDGSSPNVTNCTFSGNTAAVTGGAIRNANAGSPTVTNGVLWGNAPTEITTISGTPVVTYSTVEGGYPGLANSGSDPLLVDPNGADSIFGTLDDDPSLSFDSPASDAGNNSAVSGLSLDVGGNPRIVDNAQVTDTGAPPASAPYVDRGAFEYQPPFLTVPGDFATLQQAIDLAPIGSTVVVAAGTYFEAINFGGKAMTLRSSDGPDVTTIDGTGFQHVVLCVTGELSGTILEGFTITGGVEDSDPLGGGGGMLISASSPTVIDCVFTDNLSVAGGGGMGILNGSTPLVTDCVFRENVAGSFFAGTLFYNSGGGMRIRDSSPTIRGCTFIDNEAHEGGAIHMDSQSAPVVTDCMFVGNQALNNQGGGIYIYGSDPTVFQCVFSGNYALNAGGGIEIRDVSNAVITNCVFSGNVGNGLGEQGTGASVVTNCIFWGNVDTGGSPWQLSGFGADVTLRHCDIEGGIPGPVAFPEWIDGGGNIGVDPLFLDADGADDITGTEDDDLRLGVGSPCSDAGDNAAVLSGVLVDFAGAPRFFDNVVVPDSGAGGSPYVDMGPYEVQSADLIRVPSDVATIQQGIDLVRAGGTVLVAPGTYVGGLDFGGRLITVISSDGPEVTTIDAGGAYHAVEFISGEGPDTVLDGFTITGGEADGPSPNDQRGGGLYISGADPTIRNCHIVGNAGINGGGVYVGQFTFYPRFIDCTIANNTAFGSAGPSGNGGGVSIDLGGIIIAERCALYGNTAEGVGGGVFGSAILRSCLVYANQAGGNGGGCFGGVSPTNCTIVANTAGGVGGGIFNSSLITARNNIIRDNVPDGLNVLAIFSLAEHNVLQEPWVGVGVGNLVVDPLFVDADGPDDDALTLDDNDYRITAGSPAVDAGDTPEALATGMTTDVAGLPRFVDMPSVPDSGIPSTGLGSVDIGAYEYQPTDLDLLIVTRDTGDLGDGVQLLVDSPAQWYPLGGGDFGQLDGFGTISNGTVYAPTGGADLWHRATGAPTFEGALVDTAQWMVGGSFTGGSYSEGLAVAGAAHGTDNWMKVIRGDGAVSWAQFEFDFDLSAVSPRPVLVSIPLYVTRSDGADFPLAEAALVAGDSCSGLKAVAGMEATGTLADATNDGSATCAAAGTTADVWWEFSAPCSGDLTVTTCGSEALGSDTALSLHSSCPGTTVNQITCNDDTGLCAGASLDSGVTATLAGGETVYVRVSHYGFSTPGEFVVQFDMPCDCSPIFGLTCASSPGLVELSWSPGTVAYDTIHVRRDGVLIDAIDGLGLGYQTPSPASGTYTYEVEGFCHGVASGAASCLVTVADPPPTNDDCGDAISISEGTFFGTTLNATNDSFASCGSSSSSADVWYEYTATGDGTLVVNTCGTNDTPGPDLGIDTVLTFFDGCGGGELECNDDALFGSDPSACDGAAVGNLYDSAISYSVSSGDVIAIRVATFGASPSGDFQLNVEFSPDAPVCTTCVGIRGDVNGDASINIADAVYLLSYLFSAGPSPAGCLAVGDANSDGTTNIADAIYLLDFLFVGGLPPAAPGYPTEACLDTP